MKLLWKLLRQHISIAQFVGFFFANLLGMFIVLFGFQLYRDVLPIFTQSDSFMKGNNVIVSKRIGMGTTFSGRSNTFSNSEIADLSAQPFVEKIGRASPQPIIRLRPRWALTVQTFLIQNCFLRAYPTSLYRLILHNGIIPLAKM